MLPKPLILSIALLAVPCAAPAQEAVPRDGGERADAPAEPAVRQAVPRGSRPQGDNPRTGTAVPRSGLPPVATTPDDRDRDRGRADNRGRTINRSRTVIVQPPSVYGYYYPYSPYLYPRRYYPYGYGAFGLGYFYYDPYRWSSSTYPYWYRRPFSVFDIGELRLDVTPRHAHVYVDGYYAGVVDDYNGAFQALKLEAGEYQIEIVAPGYETLTFDVRLAPGQKIKYRGELRRVP